MAEKVERNGMREHPRNRIAALQHVFRLPPQLLHGLSAGTAGRLIGGNDDAADLAELSERGYGHQRNDGGAVWVCDNAVVLTQVIGIDFRDHQWYIRLHPKRR